MKNDLKKQGVVINLHERGFTDDFQLVGDELLWVQGNTYLRSQDFAVLESYQFVRKSRTIIYSDLILAVHSLQHNTKGILIRHFIGTGSTGNPGDFLAADNQHSLQAAQLQEYIE